ncbi:MAG: hypothetical protein H6565_03630 [Lewinellaceae bacterium]|nr:hypothetical protein [Lewinellaceae bacterium]
MKTIYQCLTLLVLFTITVASTGNAQNLIKNGGFDGNPSYTDWKIEVVEGPTASRTSGGNPGGYVWLNHAGRSNDPAVAQTLNGLTPGTEYTVEGDYRAGDHFPMHNRGKSIKDILALDIDGKQLATFRLPEPWNKWTRFSATFTATGTSHTIRLRGEINGADADVALDNVEVKSKADAAAENRRFVVEMMGKRGVLTFSDDLDKKPTGVKITLYGTARQVQQEYELGNGYWRNDILRVSGTLNVFGNAKQVSLKLKVEGDKLVGNMTENNVFLPFFPVIGTRYSQGLDRLPPQNNPAKKYDLVVLNLLQAWSGPWWTTIPVKEIGAQYKMVNVTYDPKENLFRLYEFPDDLSTNASIDQYLKTTLSVKPYIRGDVGLGSDDENVFAEALLQMVFEVLVRYPCNKFALKYTGHGASYESFERVRYSAQAGFYPAIADLLGKRIEYLDWSTNCNAASLYNLKQQAPYANYILANDLRWGGCFFDGKKSGDLPVKTYGQYMTKSGDTKTNLSNYVGAINTWLNNSGNQECYAKGGSQYERPQQVTLFDCRAVERLVNDPGLNLAELFKTGGQSKVLAAAYYSDGSQYGDLRTYISTIDKSKVSLFDQTILKQANNRASFTWQIPAQGINFDKK